METLLFTTAAAAARQPRHTHTPVLTHKVLGDGFNPTKVFPRAFALQPSGLLPSSAGLLHGMGREGGG